MTFRPLFPGMGQAVAERTILRKVDERWETWGEVAERVAKGNTLLDPKCNDYEVLRDLIARGVLLTSGRHLQHGDETQPTRSMEVFTNCSTVPTSWLSFLFLSSGSGCGRCYDDALMLVDWDHAPNLRCVLDDKHPDFDPSAHESYRDAMHKYGPPSKTVMWHTVEDSREGWAKALEIWETSAFEKIHKDKMLILDFSKVRPKGTPIGGMQNKPAAGPVEVMNSFGKAAKIKGCGMAPWKQAMYIDHYFSECVSQGGTRRSARLALKWWKDETIFDFIRIKRPIEFNKLGMEDVIELRKHEHPMSFLWSANNSIAVDTEFWNLVNAKKKDAGYGSPLHKHAKKVFQMAVECNYGDGTGEPGFVNVDKLVWKSDGLDAECYKVGQYIGSDRYTVDENTQVYLAKIWRRIKKNPYQMTLNPCGEILIFSAGGVCVIGDVVPYFARTVEDAERGFRQMTRFLIRVNTMPCIYRREIDRTNRIGVGITGIHEFAWATFGFGFRDLLDEAKSQEFWNAITRFRDAVVEEAIQYCSELGVPIPHTMLTFKPSGTTAKLFGLTEGCHLPSMRKYLRWVQFKTEDPLVKIYRENGYPTRELKTYLGTTIVGFPTAPVITTLGMGDKLVTAAEATPEEQYKWLQLLEKYWITGVNSKETGDYGNQISYTLKYKPDEVTFDSFRKTIQEYQPFVKVCSVMPQADVSSYEYQPEEPISDEDYHKLVTKISRIDGTTEDIGQEHVECAGGSCPIDFKRNK